MFRWGKTLDVITLFHRPAVASSVRALALLKEASATAGTAATLVQAGDHPEHNKLQRDEFELNVTEETPTADQLHTILEYLGANRAGDLIKGAKDEEDAVKTLRMDPGSFQWPVVVDWGNGRAAVGGSESEIIRLLKANHNHT